MVYRNRKVERCILNFLRSLPTSYLAFPFDIVAAINTLKNCKIHTYQEFAEFHNITINEVVSFCESITGCSSKYGENFIIMYNDCRTVKQERKTFTLAHELGHILLGHFDDMHCQHIAQDALTNKNKEREANHFAACLLCPPPIIYSIKPKSSIDVGRIFGLSGEASDITWNDYINYNKHYFTSWHNDIINLFNVNKDNYKCFLI